MLFARAFPVYIGEHGLPISWRVYLAGMTVLARSVPIEQLRISRAVRAANANVEDFERFVEESQARGGVPVVPSQEDSDEE